jgi:hypothetical protein
VTFSLPKSRCTEGGGGRDLSRPPKNPKHHRRTNLNLTSNDFCLTTGTRQSGKRNQQEKKEITTTTTARQNAAETFYPSDRHDTLPLLPADFLRRAPCPLPPRLRPRLHTLALLGRHARAASTEGEGRGTAGFGPVRKPFAGGVGTGQRNEEAGLFWGVGIDELTFFFFSPGGERSSAGENFAFYSNVPQILRDTRARNIPVAAASRTEAPDLARDMLKLLLVDGKQRAIDYFDYMQIYPGSFTPLLGRKWKFTSNDSFEG